MNISQPYVVRGCGTCASVIKSERSESEHLRGKYFGGYKTNTGELIDCISCSTYLCNSAKNKEHRQSGELRNPHTIPSTISFVATERSNGVRSFAVKNHFNIMLSLNSLVVVSKFCL